MAWEQEPGAIGRSKSRHKILAKLAFDGGSPTARCSGAGEDWHDWATGRLVRGGENRRREAWLVLLSFRNLGQFLKCLVTSQWATKT